MKVPSAKGGCLDSEPIIVICVCERFLEEYFLPGKRVGIGLIR